MQPGSTVGGRFVIERLAGAGGMGAVYAARDRLVDRPVALKVLTASGFDADERFEREATLLASIEHPSIVRYLGHGVTDAGAPYLVTEWLEGEDLASRLSRGGLSIRESIALASTIAGALGTLHRRGIVHRDVKPSNVFLAGGSIRGAKLLDLGIARPMEGTGLTRSGVALGTPGYMPPEQIRGDRVLDARTDVFALGCVLFECIAGRPPFAGDHAIAILARILLEPPRSPSELCLGVPEALDALVGAMLAKEPDARPADGAAVARALGEISLERGDLPAVSSKRPSVRVITESERRMISVIVSAPLGSAATVATDDSEEVERGLAAIAATRGAELSMLQDGSILITFGGEGAATDRAVRVARSALRIRELLPRVPLAVATGRVTVSRRADGAMSIGEAVARAARTLGPGANGVSIDATTAQLLDARFEVAGHGDALELVGERSVDDEARTVLGRRTPCVGRERELGMLASILDECVAESAACAALVVGPPGIGKSRIRHELLRRVAQREEPITIWLARADPVGRGSPLAAIAQAVRNFAGALEGEPIAARQAKIAAVVARSVAAPDRPRLTELLAELAGAPMSEDASPRLRAARLDPMLMGDELRRAFEDFLRAECARQPVLLVIEDLHWSDRATVLWIDAVLRNVRDARFMVLALARPEVHEVFPKLWRGRSITEISVPELSRRASERLAREVLGPDAPIEAVERLVARAAGNAFYLEELIRAAGEGASSLPETVLAMVHSRLSTLDAEVRRALRGASVFGQVFWRSGLSALFGAKGDLDRALDELCAREFVERRGKGKFPGEEELAFRHALVRDAAYSMLTQDDLHVGHRLAGEWLEAAGEADAMVLAEHFELGNKAHRAIDHLVRGAEVALEGNDFDAVLSRVGRGARAGAQGEILGKLSTLAAEARMWRGEFEEAAASATDAMNRLPRGAASWCAAAAQLAFALVRLARTDAARALATELRAAPIRDDATGAFATAISRIAAWMLHAGEVDLAEALLEDLARVAASVARDPRTMGSLHTLRATVLVRPRGDAAASLEESFENLELAVACYVEAGDLRRACVSRSNLGSAATELGQLEMAEEYLSAAFADAERLGISVTMSVRENLGKLWIRAGKTDAANALLTSLIEDGVARRHLRCEGVSRCYRAWLLFTTRDLDAALEEARRAERILESMPSLRANALGVLARVLLALGRVDEALARATHANELRESIGGNLEEGDATVRLALAEALRAAGRVEESKAAIAAAEARLLARARQIDSARYRESFLGRIEENARTLELAKSFSRP